MSQTPTYDQLRGERINTDVPAGEADPQPVDRPGRHRLQDAATAESAVPAALLGRRADLAGSHPRFGREKRDKCHEAAATTGQYHKPQAT
ncbi:MAG: hypothetical protein JO296_00915 [Pseudonocardiales bacterium]|nr:hypothetical protein [Pseudonocardiales bacterium]MBV9648686.1 hypothetical protein [Pseudonocardiales bacterium]